MQIYNVYNNRKHRHNYVNSKLTKLLNKHKDVTLLKLNIQTRNYRRKPELIMSRYLSKLL